MKIYKSALVLLTIITLTLALVPSGQTEWLGGEDSEYIVIIRVDNSSVAPLHEIDQGVYGRYDSTDVFITMLDLNRTNPGPVSPFTWDDIKWVPGPMDADTTGGTQ